MSKLLRVGTTYLPVKNIKEAVHWYVSNLDAVLNYEDNDKAILDLANQSFFLVKVNEKQNSNFVDSYGNERFTLTFEVNGLTELEKLHQDLSEKGVKIGEIEDRGHAGNNFIFYDLDGNKFDVWSELSPDFKKRYLEDGVASESK
ncbi:VOC family protein [Bacillus sp. 31A1R]|uniref:VOC family protein n=1 Tax=Robertmurraya mangrovi TaxID=3098077 RepID=A0ABU5IWM9_9BACI|nr:VOC family protein [Bacillus sp. 31A1R]MDZ5471535.1 VOC family protein [Bacillus sp. 31A1R]